MTAPHTMVGERNAQFGRYRLERLLSRGGMGEIYLASMEGAAGFRKRVCIKKILPHLAREEEFVDRFVDEAHIVVQLTHGNIVPVLDMGEVDGNYFIAMEYIAGRDLRDIVKTYERNGDVMPAPLAAWLINELTRALNYAHKKSDEHGRPLHITHRDVSPSNVLVSREGVVKLTDFGIAKAVGKLGKSITGRLQGKFCYMSPEQAVGESVGPLSDQFSLGAVAYELMTGVRPFDEESDLATLEAVKRADVPPPSRHRPELPAAVDATLARALARDPKARFDDVAELGRALLRAVAPLGQASETDMAAELERLYPEGVESTSGARSLDELLAEGAEALLAADGLEDTVTASAPKRPELVLTPSGQSPPATPYPVGAQMTPSSPYPTVDVAAVTWRRSLMPLVVLVVLATLGATAVWVWPGFLLDGQVRIACTPATASVLVDELMVGNCGVLVPDVSPGSREVCVRAPDYDEVCRTVQVERGETALVSLQLTPSRRVEARLWIEDPDGSAVAGEGRVVLPNGAYVRGGEPFSIDAGTWQFQVEARGYETRTVSLKIDREQPDHHVPLQPVPPIATAPPSETAPREMVSAAVPGDQAEASPHEARRDTPRDRSRPRTRTIELTDVPEGAEVEVDGEHQRVRGTTATLTFPADATGTHSVTVTANGAARRFDLDLTDSPDHVAFPREERELRWVRVWPFGHVGRVFVDGELVGTSEEPREFQLAVGVHSVRVVVQGDAGEVVCNETRNVTVGGHEPVGLERADPERLPFCQP